MECLACGASFAPQQHRGSARVCFDCARACRICGGKHQALGLCSRHHMRWLRARKPDLRAFIAAGEDAGRLTGVCEVCGRTYLPGGHGQPKRGCSRECRRILRRPYQRAKKRAEYRAKRDLLLARHKRYYQRHGQRWNKEKYLRDMADPVRRARVLRQAREGYARHAAVVQARRRAAAAALSDSDLAERIARMRRYCREWRRKQRNRDAGASTAAADRARRRSNRELSVRGQLAALKQELQKRLETDHAD